MTRVTHRTGYWDPMPEARRVVAGWTGEPARGSIGEGRWEQIDWRTVPGPFYTGETDTCGTGPLAAPGNVLTDEDGVEFVFRQPRTPAEVAAVLRAAWDEVLGGYAWDGDTRWTPAGVRAWWAGRARVRAWAATYAARLAAAGPVHPDAVLLPAARAFDASFDTELPAHLGGYLFFLDHGRPPGPGERLPPLA